MLLQFVLASFKDEFWVVRSSSLLNVLYLTLAKIGEKIHSYISEIHYEINYCMEKPNNITVLVVHCIKHCMGCTVFFLSCQVWIHQRARLACHIQPSNVLFFVLMALHWTLYTCIFFFFINFVCTVSGGIVNVTYLYCLVGATHFLWLILMLV